jgi:hypothetical protein
MRVFKWAKIAGGLLGIAVLTFLAVRIYDTQRGLPLESWHTYVPHELRAEKLCSGQSIFRRQPNLSGAF